MILFLQKSIKLIKYKVMSEQANELSNRQR